MDVDKIIKIAKYFNLPERYSLTGSKDISKIKDESMQKLLEFYINLYDKLRIKKDLIYKTNDLEKKGFLLKDYKIMYNEFEGIWSNILSWLENKKQDVIDLEILGG